MPYKSAEDKKAASRRHYARNKEKVIASVKARKKSNKEWWQEFKRTLVCWHCGEDDPACIDLHHVIKNKTGKTDISAYWATHHGRSRERILKDLENCVPLCCNCHRKVHAEHRRMLREASAESERE